MLYANFYTDAGGREAQPILKKLGNDVCDLEGALTKCPEGAVAVFTSRDGKYTGKYLRHGTVESLRARGMHVPAWATRASYAIALRPMPFNGHRTAAFLPGLTEALASVSRKLTPPAKPAKVKKGRGEWTSGHHAHRRRATDLQHAAQACA